VRRTRRALGLVLVAAAAVSAFASAPPSAGPLTLDALIDIRHPSQAVWSPDARHVAFLWDRAGAQDVWVAEPNAEPRRLTRFADGLLDGVAWSKDAARVLFEKDGDLWSVPTGPGEAVPVWTTPEAEGDTALSPDGTRVAFVRGGDVWVRPLEGGAEARLTQTGENESNLSWSPDGARLAFTAWTATPRLEATPFLGPKMTFHYREGFRTQVGMVAAAGGPVVPITGEGNDGAPRWLDATRLTLQRVSPDLKTREILLAEAAGGPPRVLHRDTDARFWSLTFLGAEPVPSPDGKRVAFVSDMDGWDHLYVVDAAGGPARALTHGRFEVSRPAWEPRGRRIAFDSNQGDHPGRRQLFLVDASGGAPVAVTTGPGTHTAASWSPDERSLLYQATDPRNSADLWVTPATEGARGQRLTDSLPAAVDRDALVPPQLVWYPSRDGQKVPAYLFVPSGLDRTARHPAIVWVHGDGITQNFDGWHTRRDYAVYYSFHQYLAQRGYVVLAVDYRGSIGYGRDWRQGHYRDLGGRDYEDVAAGVDYLAGLGYVDRAKVGVWGLSYGGFMALQALTVTPELFACAIDVAGVADWRNWSRDPDGPWIRGRLGRPEEDPELFRRTAPIEKVDRIVRPLLVMHGTADVNVPFLESLRLVDVALRAGKPVDFVVYPGEYHYFQRAHVLRDAWSRAERFFDRHLRGR
jgi:dipeptidyl aminopeptidase/acylaminoacyl peptidase